VNHYFLFRKTSTVEVGECIQPQQHWSKHVVRYFIVIVTFYCANTTAIHMSDWKFSEGGRLVKLDCKMGPGMKKVENQWFRGSKYFHLKNVGEPIEYSIAMLQLICFDSEKFHLFCSLQNNTNPSL